MSFGAGLAGFTTGLAQGIPLGNAIKGIIEDKQIADVRAQGIAEAQAMQANAAPKVQDNGDMQNLTSNPQMSRDPTSAEPVNTDLNALVNAQQAQRDGGPQSQPVAPPQVQDTSKLSDVPLASAAPGAAPRDPETSPAFANGLPQVARKRFNVDGKEFDRQDQADAYARQNTPDVSNFYDKALVPRMKAALIAQGKIEEADRWEKYASSEKSRKYGETWLKAVKLAQQEDYDGAAAQLVKLHPEFEDGYDLLSAEKAKGEDGTSGFNMRVRGPDGKVIEMYQNSRTIVEMGAPQLSPIEAFKKMDAKQTQADLLQAKEAIDVRNDGRTADRQMANTKERDKAAEERQTARDKASAERADTAQKAKLAQAREGWAARAKLDADRLAKLGEFRKAVSPEERQAIVVSGLSKDPMFNMLSPEEKRQRVEDTMALIPKAKPAAQTVPNPAADPKAQGIQTAPSAPAPAPAGKKAVPVFNPATNKVELVYR